MPLTDIECDIAKAVVRQFLDHKKSTSHKLLVRRFKDPKSLEHLVHAGIISPTSNREAYVPKVLAFQYCGDAQALDRARTAVTMTLHVLKNLFEVELERETFTPADVEQHAGKMYDQPPLADEIGLGLFLVAEFANVLKTCSLSLEHCELTNLQLSDNIVVISDIEGAWDEHVREHSRYLEKGPEPILNAFEQKVATESSLLSLDPTSPTLETTPATHRGLLVFISHSSKDADLALALIDLLQAALGLLAEQIRCSSVDGYRLPVGVNTESKLREDVNASKVVIGLITPSSLSSHYVVFELGARWGSRLFLAPLLAGVGSKELSAPLSLLNALSANNEAQLHQLVEDVSKQLEIPLQRVAAYVRHVSIVKGDSD